LARGTRTIDEGIVRVHEGEVHLRHDDVRVVARVTDDGRPFWVSQQVAAAWRCQQFGRIVALEQKRMPDRSIAVESLEVQPRRPRVPQSRDVCMRLRRRSIGGDVMGDELAEKGPAAASDPSEAGSSAASPQSHRPPRRPSANSNSCSALNDGRSGKRRPYIDEAIDASIGRCAREGERHWSVSRSALNGRVDSATPGSGSRRVARRRRNQRALVELGPEVPRVRINDHLAGVVARAEALTDQFIEAELLGTGDLNRAIDWRAHRDLADGLDDVISRHGLNEYRWQPNRRSISRFIGDARDELEELRRVNDRVRDPAPLISVS
jgi:hypothetical protein